MSRHEIGVRTDTVKKVHRLLASEAVGKVGKCKVSLQNQGFTCAKQFLWIALPSVVGIHWQIYVEGRVKKN